jgi:hypothetical protein
MINQANVAASLLRSMMDSFRDGYIQAISIDKIFPSSKVQEEFREPTSGELQLGQVQPASASTTA